MITSLRKFLLTLTSVAALGASSATSLQAQEASSLNVLTINGKEFSLNLAASIANQVPEDIKQQPLENYYGNVIDRMIDTYLAAEAARASGLAENPFLKEIAEHTMDLVLAEAWLSEEINAIITEEMILTRYNDIVADTEGRTELRARHILVETKEEAKAAIRRLNQGEDFATLAIELSTGPSGPSGGELGYFSSGDMVPSFEAASLDLATGRYTRTPVQTQFGWHVIYLEDRRIAAAPELDDIRGQLVNALSVQIAGQIIGELRNKAEISQRPFEEVRDAENARQGITQ